MTTRERRGDYHGIRSGPSATTNTGLSPEQRTAALRNLCIEAVDRHPGDSATAEVELREVAAILGLLDTPITKTVGCCRNCGRERSLYSASQHTGGPEDLCTTCGRATRKAANQAATQPIEGVTA